MGKTITGGGGSGLTARFPVDADLSPFQAQVDEAVKNALIKFGILREQENGKFEVLINEKESKSSKKREEHKVKWEGLIEEFDKKTETAMNRTRFKASMVLRVLYSQVMQTWDMIAKTTGLAKNQTYQMISNLISGVVGLISTAQLAASTLAAIPVVGPMLALASMMNATYGMQLNIQLQAQQSAIQNFNDYMGNVTNGDDF